MKRQTGLAWKLAGSVLAAALWSGCAHPPPPTRPLPPTVRPEVPHDVLLPRLIGPWRPTEKDAAGSQMTFEPDGNVIFKGGLADYNPAHWELDRARHELRLRMPQAPDEKLDIFRMQLGDGVAAFDRAQKEVTYHFDEETSRLNVAGWTYERAAAPAAAPGAEAEPVLK